MKVLLISPESPFSFWTLREICRMMGAKAALPQLGLITAAALLPPDWELRMVDRNIRPITEREWDWAEMVMTSGMGVHRDDLLAIIREAKLRKKIVVAGGSWSSLFPEEMTDAGCDFVIRGEGENTIPLLLSALGKGISGGIFENPVKPDITDSPVPRFDLLRLGDYLCMAIQVSRGCPFDCEFCDIVNLYGRKQRYKTPDQVIEELETLLRLGWRGAVFVSDDNFIGNRAHARAVLEKLLPWMKSHGEPFYFWTQVSVNLGQDREMIDLMTAANFSHVFVGIESPDKDVLALNRKYHNIRYPLLESLDNMNRNGLTVMGSFIVGFDGEKKGAGERICAFVEQSNIPVAMINTLIAPPNSRLWDRLKKEGRLLEERTRGDSIGGRPNYLPTRPESEIMAECADAWDYLYEPSRYLARAYRYYLNMRPTRCAMAIQRGDPAPEEHKDSRKPLRSVLRDVVGLFYFLWWQGTRPTLIRQFWRQLFGMWMRNPSRLVQYASACIFCEVMFRLRGEVRKRVESAVSDSHSSGLPDQRPRTAASGGT